MARTFSLEDVIELQDRYRQRARVQRRRRCHR